MSWVVLLDPAPWMDDAACAQTDPDLFFPEQGDWVTARAAQQVCAECPVRNLCLEYALENGEGHGIWGGLTPDGRYRLLRARRRAVA